MQIQEIAMSAANDFESAFADSPSRLRQTCPNPSRYTISKTENGLIEVARNDDFVGALIVAKSYFRA
jgi:hypothetical protein